jgi:hypothetical protein
MTNETIQVLIGSGGSVLDVSSRIVKMPCWIQRPITNGIGSWQLELDNGDSGLNERLVGDEPITVSINNVEQFAGYIDKKPRVLNGDTILLSGRDSGQDLQNKLLWSLYCHTDSFSGKADDIIADMLTKTSSEIGFTSPHTAPEIYYSNGWVNLADQFKEICENINYIGYTDKDLGWNMWPIASGRDSGITLKSLLEDATNNVIGDVEYEPDDTQEVRNYLIVEGPKTNDDAYTELTASFWATIYTGDVLSDFTGTSPLPPMAGAAAFKCTSSNGVNCGCKLTFPKFWLNYLDFHLITSDALKVNLLAHFTGSIMHAFWAKIILTDTLGNIMSWRDDSAGGIEKWKETTVKIGYNENDNANWVTESGDKANFNWKVTEIKIDYTYNSTVPGVLGYILIDGLKFPAGTVAAHDSTSGSCVHTVREEFVSRTDITTQVELQQYADQLGPKLATAIETLNLTAMGNAGLIGGSWMWLPGCYAKANIKDKHGNYLVPLNSKWRFMELKHVFDPKAPNKNHIYTVELKMVPFDTVIDNYRWTYNQDPESSPIRKARDRLRYIEQTQSLTIEPQAP